MANRQNTSHNYLLTTIFLAISFFTSLPRCLPLCVSCSLFLCLFYSCRCLPSSVSARLLPAPPSAVYACVRTVGPAFVFSSLPSLLSRCSDLTAISINA
jgi:hypothetical protein